MAYTSHGHHIPGTIKGEGTLGSKARCGGPGLCPRCSSEVASRTLRHRMVGEPADYQARAKTLVRAHVDRMLAQNYPVLERPVYDVYVVWFVKTLQNWKTLVSTTIPDDMYYELTYDGDKRTVYFDAYKKFENYSIPDEEN